MVADSQSRRCLRRARGDAARISKSVCCKCIDHDCDDHDPGPVLPEGWATNCHRAASTSITQGARAICTGVVGARALARQCYRECGGRHSHTVFNRSVGDEHARLRPTCKGCRYARERETLPLGRRLRQAVSRSRQANKSMIGADNMSACVSLTTRAAISMNYLACRRGQQTPGHPKTVRRSSSAHYPRSLDLGS